ncbi:hypothetical protein predicted by Glimmer/Critica [Acetobacter senegalensis]|uniref:Uncharacterized protein n=1 Tax=Acetobacter senegalensis TaxID=446692 RepID=A0A0U5B8P1_9PROT|nr:hypothetical protein predicted by Glimmer/Critica [Acetobacter senegalensis]
MGFCSLTNTLDHVPRQHAAPWLCRKAWILLADMRKLASSENKGPKNRQCV